MQLRCPHAPLLRLLRMLRTILDALLDADPTFDHADDK